jgi:hypothetical protein
MIRKILKWTAIALVAILLLAQAYRPERENPPIDPAATIEARTEMPAEVAAMLERSCSDCHSHDTEWPWYSNVAPVSWLVAHDVEEGREHLNLSDWARYGNEDSALHLGEICKEVRNGAMPLGKYVRMHPEAELSAEDREALCEWTKVEGRRLLSQAGAGDPARASDSSPGSF